MFHGAPLARDGSGSSEVTWGHLNLIKLGTGRGLAQHQPEYTKIPLKSLSRLPVQKQAMGRQNHQQSLVFVQGPHLVSNTHIEMLLFHSNHLFS